MGRSQSTPGLVESTGRIALEDMWIPPVAPIAYQQRSLLSSPPSTKQTPESPGAVSTSSGRSHQQILSVSHDRRSGESTNKTKCIMNFTTIFKIKQKYVSCTVFTGFLKQVLTIFQWYRE